MGVLRLANLGGGGRGRGLGAEVLKCGEGSPRHFDVVDPENGGSTKGAGDDTGAGAGVTLVGVCDAEGAADDAFAGDW